MSEKTPGRGDEYCLANSSFADFIPTVICIYIIMKLTIPVVLSVLAAVALAGHTHGHAAHKKHASRMFAGMKAPHARSADHECSASQKATYHKLEQEVRESEDGIQCLEEMMDGNEELATEDKLMNICLSEACARHFEDIDSKLTAHPDVANCTMDFDHRLYSPTAALWQIRTTCDAMHAAYWVGVDDVFMGVFDKTEGSTSGSVADETETESEDR